MVNMDNKKCQKMPNIFECSSCDFKCSKKSNYLVHLLTPKHQKYNEMVKNGNKKCQKMPEENFTCDICEKSYKHLSGLSRHKKTCKTLEVENEILDLNNPNNLLIIKDLVLEVVKSNSELQKQVLEICKNGTYNTNTNNSHNNNKTFNLQVFLNETCKDAMNIMDFVDSIKIQLEDLEDVGKLGYVNGISNIIMKNLKALDITERPVHCSDSKRETLYVKHEDKWEKEDETNTRLRRAIKRVAYKNTKIIRDWRDIHPEHDNSFSKISDIYQQIVIESMGGKTYETTDTEAKIIKNIAKHVVIDKESV